jgi:hypothetical protein
MKNFATAARIAMAAAGLLAIPPAVHAQFTRIVLVEELTSVTCEPCAEAGKIIDEIAAELPARLVTVRYHTFFRPPADPFYEANKGESDARRTFYEVIGIPVIRVDGSLAPPATNKTEVRDRINDELATESPIRLDVAQEALDAGQMRVTVTATAGPDGLGDGFRLRVAVLESHIHDERYANKPTYNGEVDLHDVFRDLLPSADGDAIELGAGETKTFTYTYSIGSGWQADKMYAVAFVQDDFDKSVAQAGFSPRPVSSVETPNIAGYSARSLSSNPTSGAVTIDYALGRPGRLDAAVIDAAGNIVRTVDSRDIAATRGTLSIDLADMPSGTYTVALSSGDWRWTERIAVVR